MPGPVPELGLSGVLVGREESWQWGRGKAPSARNHPWPWVVLEGLNTG